jgi:hypothetical protein
MTRQYPPELYLGQKVLVRPNPTAFPIEALVTYIDTVRGLVHVRLRGYQQKFAAKPHAISTLQGQFLHYQNKRFFFAKDPYFA